MQRLIGSSAACAMALAVAALGSPASAINTFKKWDGANTIQPFGCPSSSTYGQVIKIPAGKTHLNRFVFSMKSINSGSLMLRGEVYAWDGTKATGEALYESAAKTISFGDGSLHNVRFNPTVAVTPGAQYVIFASVDKDYAACQNNYQLAWGYISSSAYHGGFFVFQNNFGDPTRWTTVTWGGTGGDLAFKASVSP